MPAFARRGDFWSGLALAALGAYIVVAARGWVYLNEDGPGPGFFPLWYGIAMVVLSLFLVGRTVVKAPATAPGPVAWRDVSRALSCWAAFVACVVLMRWIGFTPAFALLGIFIVRGMAGRSWVEAGVVGIGSAVLFFVLFDLLLGVPLPRATLF